ncbi:polysaccharide biosynthesis protein [Salinarchaeum sp. IM2453]|uniref:UDP-N-acetylglucosamine 4,6-dehydratase family protein n=1 Tax=Salinarchaeum sp. IM2453 TaxID=2862870 RepID=UPI001C83409D|nr:UDP-N-acetylglucosamine 4,6-dehydratase family protein [Salinarchaeum sp. IM2453]QZA89085.1 polysaccharide biosynthesis protein [Salinarchaeum sp. IM2453]
MSSLSGKNILITGGCGSIGSHLVEKVLEHDPNVVRVFDNSESGLFQLQREFEDDQQLRFLLGDVRDQDRLKLAVEDIDVVFHAAALKHVTINEYNPFETVQTNVQGTQNLIRAALEEEVESFVGISTDKASNPTSVMGATKLLSERLIIAANTYKGSRETRFGCVRFGNVLGSSGSVVPLFFDQIQSGGPVTVTDPEMTRFIMPTEEAVELVITAQERMQGGEVFVLKMPAFQVGTLAKAMIKEYSDDSDSVDVKIIGSRPGERKHEKLISREEAHHAKELDEMFVILPQIEFEGYEVDTNQLTSISSEYTSADTQLLSEKQLIETIDSLDVV